MADLLDRISGVGVVAGDLLDRVAGTTGKGNEDKGFFGTLAEDAAGIPGAVYQSVRHPIDTAVGLGKRQVDEFRKSKDEFGKRHYSEAFGHGLAGMLPVVGPAAAQAGEEFGEGKTGQASAHTFELLAPSAAKVLPESLSPSRLLAKPLRTSAEKTYAQVLAPGTKADKYLTANKLLKRPGKDLLDRGVSALTEKGLKGKIARKVEEGNQALNRAWDSLGSNHQENVLPIVDHIQQRAIDEATEVVGSTQFSSPGLPGRRIVDPALYKAYQDIALDIVERLGPVTDQASAFTMRRVRQSLDELVKGSFMGGELTTPQKIATRGATDSIRHVLNSNPTIAAVNKEISFWLSAQDVFEHTSLRRVGQKGALTRLATGVGKASGAVAGSSLGARGSVEGYLIGGYAAKKFEEIFGSTAWKTSSAVAKNRVANLLANGKVDQALGVATRAAAYSNIRNSNQDSNQEEQ